MVCKENFSEAPSAKRERAEQLLSVYCSHSAADDITAEIKISGNGYALEVRGDNGEFVSVPL